MKSLIASLLILSIGPASAELKADTTWRATKEQGGVAQSVEVVLKKLAVGTSFEGSVEWTPGTSLEITAKITKVGNERIEFTFEDSFGDTGTGTLISTGKTADLDFKVTTVVESRGARQLGPYTLKPTK